eukprot:184162_1
MQPNGRQKNKWLDQQISKRYNLCLNEHRINAYRQYTASIKNINLKQHRFDSTDYQSYKPKSNKKYLSKNGLCHHQFIELVEDRDNYKLPRAGSRNSMFLALIEESHNAWFYSITDNDLYSILYENIQYLIYTEFNKSCPNKKSSRQEIKASASRCSEYILTQRLHGILYSQCYKILQKEFFQCWDNVFRHILAGYRKAFCEKIAAFGIEEMRNDVMNTMQNDLQLIIEQNLVSKADVIECLNDVGFIGADIANIIADFLSDKYPFLLQPPPNPYYYNNCPIFSDFELLKCAVFKDLNAGFRRGWIKHYFHWIKGTRSKKIKTNYSISIGEFLNTTFVEIFHYSKCLEPFIERYYTPYPEYNTLNRLVGSVKHEDGLAFFYYKYDSRWIGTKCNVYFSKCWTDLWNFIDNDAIKIDCYTGLYFADLC